VRAALDPRRFLAVSAPLVAVVTLLPERLTGIGPTITALREAHGVPRVLITGRSTPGIQPCWTLALGPTS
jgi:hypothetical protein